MVIEHTFVTTLGATEALGLASTLLGQAGFVAQDPVATPGSVTLAPADRLEMSRAKAGESGPYGVCRCPQSLKLEYDRGRVVIAASIAPRMRRRSLWSGSLEPAPSSEAAQPFLTLMIALAEALEQALVHQKPIEESLARWKVLDGVIPQHIGKRKTVRRTIIYASLGVIVASLIGGAVRRSNHHTVGTSAEPALSFPANEDPRIDTPPDRDTFADTRLEQLIVEADSVLRNANVQGGVEVGAVFALGDRLAKAGHWPKALQYYSAALKHSPADYVHRLKYANMLIHENRNATAMKQAHLVINECEDRALVRQAQTLIGSAEVDVDPLTSLPGGKPIVVLVPMGDVDVLLIQDEQKKLHDELGIEVQVHSISLNFTAATRNPLQQSADVVRAALEKVRKDKPQIYAAMLRAVGLTQADLADNAKAVSLGAFLLRKIRQSEGASDLESLGDCADTQWSAEGMVEGFTAAVRPFARKNVRFLGVTRSDLFGDDFNYLFGYRVGDYGIISYRRFMASFNKEAPSRSRLLRRLHLQTLASAGHVFGLPRCNDPSCPRSYANSLADHDAKSDKLCETCRKGFAQAFDRVKD